MSKLSKIIRKIIRRLDPNGIFSKQGPYGAYGGFDIWHGSSCKSGHFWGYLDEVTDKKVTKQLIELFDKARKEYNWNEEEYKKQFYCNLRNNGVMEYYEEHYGIKTMRRKKLNRLKNVKVD